ncbi:flagellar motor protein MotB [Rossellomorea vietnamensis]|uniref:Flagellar motor protein MotB n=2 Tax=Bacillaceae TaxID=186817 RepID=A0A5D4M2G5_9BACI|nr:flagellar motor protein MotB [Rossellomorea vietnamensis]TYR95335.1 flagellar motor protein MotB [Rossellomorea vietnamensis]
MMRRRKKKQHDDHMDESWLIPYADLLTLLLALFVVLFASSSVDAQKFNAMSQAFNQIFTGGASVMDYPSPVPESDLGENKKADEENPMTVDEVEAAKKKDRQELEELERKVNGYITANQLQKQFAAELTSEGLLLTIRDNVLFQSGSANVAAKDEGVARELSGLLEMDTPRSVIISGHTDNIPISTANYDSNWELSVMRAVNFMKIVLRNQNLDPRWFSAKGFGEFKPLADNSTKEGRAKNRRVEVLILPRVIQ